MRRYQKISISIVATLTMLAGCSRADDTSPKQTADDAMFVDVAPDKIIDCDPEMVFLSSHSQTESDQEEVLKALKENPGNTEARVSRVMYLSLRRFEDDSVAKEFAKHSIWLAKNAPGSKAAGCTFAQVLDHSEGFDEVRKLWGEAVKANPTDYRVLKNAADYFTVSDRAFSLECLQAGRNAFPSDFGWHLGLAHLYSLDIDGEEGSEERAKFAKLAFAEQEAAIMLLQKEEGFKSSPQEIDSMSDLAEYAYEAGYTRRSRELCEEVIRRTKDESDAFADEHHTVYQVLGRIELARGNVKTAGEHLIESVSVSGSPVLDSFGPRKRLAMLLLNAGERDSVLKYFTDCTKFRRSPEFDAYVADMKEGRTPSISPFED